MKVEVSKENFRIFSEWESRVAHELSEPIREFNKIS